MAVFYIDGTKFNNSQLTELEEGCAEGLNIDIYANPNLDCFQMHQIRLGLRSGVNVDIYSSELFSSDQMREIRLGLEDNLDVSSYANPDVTEVDMFLERQRLLEERDK